MASPHTRAIQGERIHLLRAGRLLAGVDPEFVHPVQAHPTERHSGGRVDGMDVERENGLEAATSMVAANDLSIPQDSARGAALVRGNVARLGVGVHGLSMETLLSRLFRRPVSAGETARRTARLSRLTLQALLLATLPCQCQGTSATFRTRYRSALPPWRLFLSLLSIKPTDSSSLNALPTVDWESCVRAAMVRRLGDVNP